MNEDQSSLELEKSEQDLYEYNLKTRILGLNSPAAYEEYRMLVINGMIKFGPKFFKKLAGALYYADLQDSVKIIRTWRAKCEEYSMLYRIYLAKNKSIQEQTHGSGK